VLHAWPLRDHIWVLVTAVIDVSARLASEVPWHSLQSEVEGRGKVAWRKLRRRLAFPSSTMS
jgi:hypothetical protein